MRLAVLTAAALVAAAAPAFAASPVEGRWKTQGGRGVVEIAPCGAALCGRIGGTPRPTADNPAMTDLNNKDAAKRSRSLLGLPILTGFKGGPAKWTGGTIYNPEDGNSYRSSLELAGADTLKVKGCVGPICRTQTWTRIR